MSITQTLRKGAKNSEVSELQEILITDPSFPMTIPTIVNRLIPDTVESSETTPEKETWLHMMLKALIEQNRVVFTNSKVFVSGAWYPGIEIVSTTRGVAA